MKKNSKRILTLVMAVLMLTALCTAAFAAQPEQQQSTVTCYVRLQTATAPSSWNYSLGTLTNVSYLTGTAQTKYFVPVTVTKSGDITVKDIVEALSGVTVVSCTQHDSHGCIHSDTVQSGETACSCTTCNCTWKRVKSMVWDPVTESYVWDNVSYASAMNSLRYNNVTRTNSYYTEDYGGGHGYYEGTSWEFFVGNSDDNTAIYSIPDYMDQYLVNSSVYITLSFDTSSFEW